MSRRTELADAAITTLAGGGMRGLTHRAVDAAAGLPEGSTSYYFRSRRALLQAVMARLADTTTTELPTSSVRDLDDFADVATELLQRWLTTGRERQLARYELTLEATRRPELREALVAEGAKIRGVVAEAFAAVGTPEPESRARDFVAFVDGLLFDRIAGAGAEMPSIDGLRATVRGLLAAVTTPTDA